MFGLYDWQKNDDFRRAELNWAFFEVITRQLSDHAHCFHSNVELSESGRALCFYTNHVLHENLTNLICQNQPTQNDPTLFPLFTECDKTEQC